MEYDSLSRCLGGEMVDTRDLKSRAEERGGSSPLQGIMLRVLIAFYSFLYFYRSFLCRMELLELQYRLTC